MNELERLGRRISELRRERGQTREALAKGSGLSTRFLAEVEAGRGNIAFRRLWSLCAALGTPLSALARELETAGRGRSRAKGSASRTRDAALEMLERCTPAELEEIQLRLARRLESRSSILALIGLRGAGKTTIGKRAAATLGWPFRELDGLIEEEAGLELQNIFELHGEEYYRQLEFEALRGFLERPVRCILAAGGGIVTRTETFELLERNCWLIWIKAEPEDHWNRVLRQDPRPMTNYPNAFTHLETLLRQRRPLYARAHWTVDTSTLGVSKSVAQVVARARALEAAEREPALVR